MEESRSPSAAVTPGGQQKFSVKISREAVFDSVASRPHPPETTRKVSVLHLSAPVDGFAVGCEADAIAQRVLDTMLDRRWSPPQNELFGAPPFTLVSESELYGLFESAGRILMQDAMVVSQKHIHFTRSCISAAPCSIGAHVFCAAAGTPV